MDLGELLGENYAIEAHLEATSSTIGHRDISRVLTTAHNHVEFLILVRVVEGAHSDCAARFTTIVVLTDFLEGLRMKKLGVTSPACREKHGKVV